MDIDSRGWVRTGVLTVSLLSGIAGAVAGAPPPLAPGTVIRDCAGCPELVAIAGGRYVRGSDDGPPAEVPRAMVDIRAFLMGRHEVTRAEFALFVGETGHEMADGCWVVDTRVGDNGVEAYWRRDAAASWQNPGFGQDDRHPVVCVNHDDAQAYAAWLGRRTGRHYRLPSEAEWEYAARAGTQTRWSWGDDADAVCDHANGGDRSFTGSLALPSAADGIDCDDGHARTAPVGSFQPNGFGLFDMAGNVWEWTGDCWNERYAGAPADGSAWTSGDCNAPVVRSGSWFFTPPYLRSANRYGFAARDRNDGVGFRVARDP